jgi:hypothetical protein
MNVSSDDSNPAPAAAWDEAEPVMAVVMDADQGAPVFLPTDELPSEKEVRFTWAKFSAVGLALLIHAVLGFLLAIILVVVPGPQGSEITALSAPATQEQAPQVQKSRRATPAAESQSKRDDDALHDLDQCLRSDDAHGGLRYL